MAHRSLRVAVIPAVLLFMLAQANVQPPSGQPPQFFDLTEACKDGLVIQRHPTPAKGLDVPLITFRLAFKTLCATDTKGKVLAVEELARRLKPNRVVLVSADDEPVPPAFLTVVKDDTVILMGVLPQPRGEATREPAVFEANIAITILGGRGSAVVQKALEELRRIKANEPNFGEPEKGDGTSATVLVRRGTASKHVAAVVTVLMDAGVSSVTVRGRK